MQTCQMVLILIIEHLNSIEAKLRHHRKHRMDFSLAFDFVAYPYHLPFVLTSLVIIPSCLIAFPYSFRQIAIKVHLSRSHRTVAIVVVVMFQINHPFIPFDLLQLRITNYTSFTVKIQEAFEIRRLGLVRMKVSIAIVR